MAKYPRNMKRTTRDLWMGNQGTSLTEDNRKNDVVDDGPDTFQECYVDTNDTALCLFACLAISKRSSESPQNRTKALPEKAQDVVVDWMTIIPFPIVQPVRLLSLLCPVHAMWPSATATCHVHSFVVLILLAKMLLLTFCRVIVGRRKASKQNTGSLNGFDRYKYSWNWQQRISISRFLRGMSYYHPVKRDEPRSRK